MFDRLEVPPDFVSSSNSVHHKRYGLFSERRRDEEAEAMFMDALAPGYKLGIAFGKGDCFYDAVAEALNELYETSDYSVKNLRTLCHEYAVELDRKSKGNDNWIWNAFNQNSGNYGSYLANVRFTAQEKEAGEGVGDKYAVWGEQHIDARIISEVLGVKIHFIGLQELPNVPVDENSDESSSEDALMVMHRLTNGNHSRALDSFEDYQDPEMIHIAVYRGHYVPILRIQTSQQDILLEDSNSLETPADERPLRRARSDGESVLLQEEDSEYVSSAEEPQVYPQNIIEVPDNSPRIERSLLQWNGFFSARHPLSESERQAVEYVDPSLHAPPILIELDEVADGEKFQHIDCGSVFLIKDLIALQQVFDRDRKGNRYEISCPCQTCGNKKSIVGQLEAMGYIDSENTLTWEERYELILRAIVGFTVLPDKTQRFPANLALRNMLLIPEFRRVVYKQPQKGLSLLEYAIYYANEATVLLLIENGSHPAASSYMLNTPLHFAVKHKKPWAVRILLEHGANPHAKHSRDETPLQMCIRLFHQSVVTQELQVFLEISRILTNTPPAYDYVRDAFEEEKGALGRNQLHEAVYQLDEDGVRVLLAAGTDPNLQDNQGFTPLALMATPNACFDDGQNPAFVAIAMLLCEQTYLDPVLFVRSVINRKPRLCLELLNAGVNRIPNFKKYCSDHIIPYVVSQRFPVIQTFLRCLQQALTQNNIPILHIAIAALPETEQTCQFIPWLIYAEMPFAETVMGINREEDESEKYWVLNDNDVNQVDGDGESALFWAIRSNKPQFVEVLAGKEADFTIRNIGRNFPFDVARETRDENMIELVREWSSQFVEEEANRDNDNKIELARRLDLLNDEDNERDEEEEEQDENNDMVLFVGEKSVEVAEEPQNELEDEFELDEEQIRLVANYRREEGVHREENQEEYEDEQEEDEMDISSDDENRYRFRP